MTSHREEKLNVIPILLDHYPEHLVSQGTLSYPRPYPSRHPFCALYVRYVTLSRKGSENSVGDHMFFFKLNSRR